MIPRPVALNRTKDTLARARSVVGRITGYARAGVALRSGTTRRILSTFASRKSER
jgi:hypothetical protein